MQHPDRNTDVYSDRDVHEHTGVYADCDLNGNIDGDRNTDGDIDADQYTDGIADVYVYGHTDRDGDTGNDIGPVRFGHL